MLNESRWVIFTGINSLCELSFTRTNACADVMEE